HAALTALLNRTEAAQACPYVRNSASTHRCFLGVLGKSIRAKLRRACDSSLGTRCPVETERGDRSRAWVERAAATEFARWRSCSGRTGAQYDRPRARNCARTGCA